MCLEGKRSIQLHFSMPIEQLSLLSREHSKSLHTRGSKFENKAVWLLMCDKIFQNERKYFKMRLADFLYVHQEIDGF